MRRRSSRGKGPTVSFAPLRRAMRYNLHYRRVMFIAYGALMLATLAQLAVPALMRRLIDAVTYGVAAHNVLQLPEQFQSLALERLGWTPEQLSANAANAESVLISSALIIVLFAVVRGFFSFQQSYNAERLSQGVAFDLRNDIFAKIQRLSFSYHDKNQTGQLMVRATDDVEKVRIFIGQGLLLALQSVVLLTGTLIIISLSNIKLTLAILPVLPIALILFMVFGAVSQPLFLAVQIRLSKLNTILQENLAGIKVVKAFAREGSEQRKFGTAADELMHQQLRVIRVFTFLFPLIFLIANLGQAAVLWVGGQLIINGEMTLGQYQEFSLYLIFVFIPVGQLGFIITQMSQAAASAGRMFEILDAQSDVVDRPGAAALPPIQGRVEFQDVSFRYPGGAPVLDGVSFEAQPGQTVALLGATGSGKSSIINLIPRFYDATQGSVRIDGRDVREVTIDSLRQQIGIVLQETNLFTGTIRDNIAFGRPEATLDDIVEAATAAAAHEFITAFPLGYDTPVGERGTTLSGGQKQRIAIARALLLDPRILILDDSTSSVDLVTEYQIQQALDRLMQGRTSFVIAQRISTVLNADQILVLDKGRIAARGTHEALMDSSELYAQIYQSQLVEDAQLEDVQPQAMAVEA